MLKDIVQEKFQDYFMPFRFLIVSIKVSHVVVVGFYMPLMYVHVLHV